MENTAEQKEGPTDVQRQLAEAQAKEKEECWSKLKDILLQYGYEYDCTFSVNRKGIGFVVDIVKTMPKQ